MTTVFGSRPIVSTFERAKVGIVYHGEIAPEVECAHKILGCLKPWTCLCNSELSKALQQSTWVTVYENKLEYNYPTSMVTCSFPDIWRINCHISDNIGVIYFDRSVIQNAAKAEPLEPCCTHNQLSPTCCGLFGETVVIYETVPGLGKCCGGACSYLCTCCKVQNVGVNAPGITHRTFCAAENVVLPCVRDAAGLAAAINAARDKRLNAQHIEVELAMNR